VHKETLHHVARQPCGRSLAGPTQRLSGAARLRPLHSKRPKPTRAKTLKACFLYPALHSALNAVMRGGLVRVFLPEAFHALFKALFQYCVGIS
jgi:hypothetical protein